MTLKLAMLGIMFSALGYSIVMALISSASETSVEVIDELGDDLRISNLFDKQNKSFESFKDARVNAHPFREPQELTETLADKSVKAMKYDTRDAQAYAMLDIASALRDVASAIREGKK